MGDTKISGLAAVAAFATTQEFAVNDSGTSRKISGAQLQAAFPLGTLGYAEITANQAGITAQTDVTGLTVTLTPGTGRRIRITGHLPSVSSSTGTDSISLYVMEGATQLGRTTVTLTTTALGQSLIAQVILTPTSVSHTYKLQAARDLGAGNATVFASATQKAFILVEDIGV